MVVFIRQDPALSMMFSLYVTLGVFLILAVRNPSASRSLIAFTAWSSLAHAALMGTQACRNMVARGELIGVAVLLVIGVALIARATKAASRFCRIQIVRIEGHTRMPSHPALFGSKYSEQEVQRRTYGSPAIAPKKATDFPLVVDSVAGQIRAIMDTANTRRI
jgi:hypothetical protein